MQGAHCQIEKSLSTKFHMNNSVQCVLALTNLARSDKALLQYVVSKCRISVKILLSSFLRYLNYYLSYDVCAVSLRLSEKKLFNGCTYQKMLVYKVVTFLKRIKMAVLFLIFWIRSVQNGSNSQIR